MVLWYSVYIYDKTDSLSSHGCMCSNLRLIFGVSVLWHIYCYVVIFFPWFQRHNSLYLGYVPFSDEAGKKTMFMAIRNGVYGFPDEYWKSISKDAKDLIRRMLTVNPSERISASELLHESWLRCEANRTSNSLFNNTYMDAMRRTSILTKLQ